MNFKLTRGEIIFEIFLYLGLVLALIFFLNYTIMGICPVNAADCSGPEIIPSLSALPFLLLVSIPTSILPWIIISFILFIIRESLSIKSGPKAQSEVKELRSEGDRFPKKDSIVFVIFALLLGLLTASFTPALAIRIFPAMSVSTVMFFHIAFWVLVAIWGYKLNLKK